MNELNESSESSIPRELRTLQAQEKSAMESLRASEERYRIIADNVADVIWAVKFPASVIAGITSIDNVEAAVDAILDRWKFSYISPAVTRLTHYSYEIASQSTLHDIVNPVSLAKIRDAMILEFQRSISGEGETQQRRSLELELYAKDKTPVWCEIVSSYLRDDRGMPRGVLGITRDVTKRHMAEKALRESEAKLRGLFENLPDIVLVVNRNAIIQFINRGVTDKDLNAMLNQCSYRFIAEEHQQAYRRSLETAIVTGKTQAVEIQAASGLWWACRLAPLAGEDGIDHVLLICTDITQKRLALDGIKKEQRLLRRLLELHEHERQLIAYEIHDGFAQQLAGALFRLQGFRNAFAVDPATAWKSLDDATRLLQRAIDEARRLIGGLRPLILDESGIVEAIQYLVYEHNKEAGPKIEFEHDAACGRLAPPLENAIFRIVQESLQNACRHSRSERIHISLTQRDGRICIDVRDWGVGFDPKAVEERRFGLQGIRERVRLLDGRVTIESSPSRGTHIAVELPMTGEENAVAVIFDMDGVLIDSYHAHYRSWLEMAKPEGLHFTEAEFATTFGHTSRKIIARFWGEGRYDDAQIAELDERKEIAFRKIIEADFPAMPGAVELLRSLRAAGYRLAVGSSGPPENVAMVLEKLGATGLFDAVVTGADVSRGKPDPEVFLLAAQRLGVVPGNCAVIEDAPAGVAAANAAGMTSVGLLSTGRTRKDLAAAQAIVESLEDLTPQILHELIAKRQTPSTGES